MTERRLAAILSADVAGFSRLMHADEPRTFAALKRHRAATDPVIAEHGGRIVSTAGDSVLAEFASAVEAVTAAREMQRRAAELDETAPESEAVVYRIGINLGDVMVDESGDLFGDGVNVAARLQALANPGGVWVSDIVYRSVRSAIDVPFVDQGEHKVKNIEHPIRVWALAETMSPSDPAPARTPLITVPVLVERAHELEAIARSLESVQGGRGTIALVTGEAGIGKTSLLRRFLADHLDGFELWWGTCDDLLTQRPLAPFADIADHIGGSLGAAVRTGTISSVVDALVQQLRSRRQPTVMVVDDAHWADDATLDVLKSLGRRIEGLQTLLAITVREEALEEPRFRFFLADLPREATLRIPLGPLTLEGVRQLAGDERRAEDVFRVTEGNPFFVTEVLGDPDATVPATVKDALLGKVARLGDEARAVVELVSVVPGQAERWLVETCLGDVDDALDECERARILEPSTLDVRFRHVLARRSVEDALPSSRRRRLHREVLDALVARSGDPARLVHHAENAGDIDALVQFAPAAARRAAEAGAPREAAGQFERALAHADRYPDAELAELLEEYAQVSYAVHPDTDKAVVAMRRAVDLRRALGDPTKLGAALRLLSRVAWWSARRAEAEEAAEEAVAVLEAIEPSPVLAMAYSNRSQLMMLKNDVEDAVLWGRKAIAMAERFDDPVILAHALNNVGTAEMYSGDEAGMEKLRKSIQVALAAGSHDDVCRGYQNLVSTYSSLRRYEEALRVVEDELTYAEEHEQFNFYHGALLERARVWMELGEWDRAEEDSRHIVERSGQLGLPAILSVSVLGRLGVRRGAPDAVTLLSEEWDRARRLGENQVMAPSAAAWAELAWLRPDHGDEARRVLEVVKPSLDLYGREWDRGEVQFWAWRSGLWQREYDEIAEPYALQMDGAWQAAAAAWEAIGCPYQRAVALLDGDRPALVEAESILDGLGARPALDLVRRRLAGSAPAAG